MSIDIDKAWSKLHTRLSDEQLLAPDEKQVVRMPLPARIRWAATIAILCICGAAGVYFATSKENAGMLVSLQNNDVSNTLVSTLEDGSVVYLTGGATLTYPGRFATDKRMVALQGDALFDVNSNRERPFVIETEPAMIEVLGTAFNVKSADRKSFELSVQHGLVKVTLKADGVPVMVKAGERVHLETGQLHKTEQANQQQFVQYTEKMRFKDDRLENIAKVINKMSHKPVTFADSTLANRKMTITFSNNTPADMVDLLCLGMGLKYTDTGDSIVIDD